MTAGLVAIAVPALSQMTHAASPTVYPGATGGAVSQVESVLASLGYYHGAIDGVYGPELGSAVRSFQSTHDLAVDGIVGPITWGALDSATGSSAHTVSTPAPSSGGLLREGSTGQAVVQLQTLLNDHGFHLATDGVFGPATLQAVIQFQQSAGITVDGIVGTQTLGALNKPATLDAATTPAAPPNSGYLQLGSSGSAVLTLQRELTSLGFNTYGEDGVFGPDTRSAVMAFQSHEGIAVDGIAGPETLSALQRALAGTDRGTTAPPPPPTSTSSAPVQNTSLGYAISGFARSLVGSPYSYGGTSPSTGFDCSGLAMYVFAHFGINLPRTSFSQFDVGTRVSFNDLAPGDLVFFSTTGPGASHVGIYIGGGEFVAADTYATGVTIDSFSSYWMSHFVGATVPPGL
jgi:peptidoglycan hydrolase-like protein with peptidoglycan-binding domain